MPEAVKVQPEITVAPKAVSLDVSTRIEKGVAVDVAAGAVQMTANCPPVKISVAADAVHLTPSATFQAPLMQVQVPENAIHVDFAPKIDVQVPPGAITFTIEKGAIASPETQVSGGWWSTVALVAGMLYVLTKAHRHLTDNKAMKPVGVVQTLLHLFCGVMLTFLLTGCSGVVHTITSNQKLVKEAAAAAGAGYGSYCLHRSGGSIPGAADKAKTDFQTLAGRKPAPASTVGGN